MRGVQRIEIARLRYFSYLDGHFSDHMNHESGKTKRMSLASES